MSRYSLSRLAQGDLDSIWSYIARDKPGAADRMIDRLVQHFEMLARNPTMGEHRSEFTTGNYRSFSVGNYVVYFCPTELGIEIARVLHGARDTTGLF